MKINTLVIGFLLAVIVFLLLFYKGCGKPKTVERWNTIRDTVTLVKTDTFIKIPKPEIVRIYKDTGSTRYVVLVQTDTLVWSSIDTIFGSPVLTARKYSDSLNYAGNDIKATIGYDIYTADELYKIDFDLRVFNSRECPAPVICPEPKRLKNSIGMSAGYLNNSWIADLSVSRDWLSFDILYDFKNKTPGAMIGANFRF